MTPLLGSARAITMVMILGALAPLAVPPAAAQGLGGGRVERPNRALFGGGLGDVEQLLVLSGDLGIGVAQIPAPADGAVAATSRTTPLTTGAASLDYGLDLPHLTINLGGGPAARYAPRVADRPVTHYQAHGALRTRAQLTRRTEVSARASTGYEPVSVRVLFPGMFDGPGAPPFIDYQFDQEAQHYFASSGGAALTHGLSARSSLSLSYDFGHATANEVGFDRTVNTLSGRYSYNLARGLSLRLGYGRSSGRYGGGEGNEPGRSLQTHNIDAGVDFNRSLSFSRQTSFTFSTGTTAISDGATTRFDVVGSATLSHEMGRSWLAALTYDRQVGFLGAVAEPTFSDSLAATVNGLIARRVTMETGVGASIGDVGVSGLSNAYRAYHGFATLQTALSRSVGLSVTYVHYYYRFDNSSFLPTSVSTNVNRRSVQVALNLFAPLFHRARTPNVTR